MCAGKEKESNHRLVHGSSKYKLHLLSHRYKHRPSIYLKTEIENWGAEGVHVCGRGEELWQKRAKFSSSIVGRIIRN